jgi:hypothetical protein
MKKENKNVYEPEQRRHYKKRYLLRKFSELEAQQEIKKFLDSDEDIPTDPEHKQQEE